MSKPNILILHVDEQRAESLRQYGNTQVITPNIDALAQEAEVYQNHFCSYPVCTPSRYSLFTGRYVSQHLGWSNHCTIPAGMSTFPKALKAAGYQTAAVGKMHMAPTYLDIGFDRMTLAEQDGPGRFDDDYHRDLMAHGLLDEIDLTDQRSEYRAYATREYFHNFGTQVSDLPEEFHSTNWITDRALEEVERWQADSPNLLFVGYIKPHHPFDPSERYLRMYDGMDVAPLPGYTPEVPKRDYQFSHGYFDNADLSEEMLRRVTRYYYASITQIDDQIGRIIARLKEKGMYDNTLILYTSDHGDYMGFHHMMLKGNLMYDPVMRVPLMIKYPAGMAGEPHQDGLSCNIQVANHLLRCCGLPEDPAMNRHPLELPREFVFSQNSCGPVKYYMVRSARYKLLLSGSSKKAMLFDLQHDPLELHDVSGESAYQSVVQDFKNALMEELLFEGQTAVHLDEQAPLIPGHSHPSEQDRKELSDYFQSKFSAFPESH